MTIISIRHAVRIFILVLLVMFITTAIQSWLINKSYTFSQESIANVTCSAITKATSEGNNTHERIFELVVNELSVTYPGHIMSADKHERIFINNGGWMGSVIILHASTTEYLVLAGTAIHTSGHCGRHWVDTYHTIVEGSFRQWKEGSVDSVVYLPGSTAVETVGEVVGMEWSPGTWMVEYGRGFIPSTLWFSLSGTIFGTTDFYNLYKMMRITMM